MKKNKSNCSQNGSEKKVGVLQKLNLSSKIAIIISVLLFIIFTVLISFVVILSQDKMGKTIGAELKEMSESNAIQIQEVLNSATQAGKMMLSSVQNSREEEIKNPSSAVITDKVSKVLGAKMSESNAKLEEYLIQTIKATISNNPDVVGMGIMFEPNAMQKDIKDYSIYINADSINSPVKPYADYATYSQEDYYKLPVAEKKGIVTKPYKYKDDMIVSVSLPIMNDSKVDGIVVADISIKNFDKIETSSDRYKSMYATIYNENGDIIYDSEDAKNIGKNIEEFTSVKSEMDSVKASFQAGNEFEITTTREDGRKVIRYFNPIHVGDATWWGLTAINRDDAHAAVRNTTTYLIIIAIISLFIVVLVVAFTLKKMLNPIKHVVDAATNIANGNFDISLEEAKYEDEIGVLTKTFMKTAANLKNVILDITRLLNSIASKDLDVVTEAEYIGDLSQIEQSLQNITNNLSQVMSSINESADQVASGADQVSGGAQMLSQGATEQASTIQELSATVSQIADKVRANAEYAQNASTEADNATVELKECNNQMDAMVEAVNRISDKSNQIGKIINTIDEIAFQTNILALNAAVEAARAGAAGKGFAVVADEVRNLASKSAEAAKNTTTLIAETIQAVKDGTEIVDSTAEVMGGIVVGASKVTELVNEIAIASSDQAAAIAEVTQGIEQISAVVQNNSATAEESAAASEELSGQAQILKGMISEFNMRESNENPSKYSESEMVTSKY